MPRVGIPPGAALQNVQKHGGPTHVGPVTLPQLTEPSQNLNHESQYGANPRATPADSTRSARSFSPFAQGSQASFAYEDVQEGMHIGQAQDHLRRASVVSAADRAPLGLVAEGGSPYSDYNGPASNFPPNGSYDVAAGNLTSANYAAGKGSRFAKFFDTKSRDGQGPQVLRKNSGLLSTSPHPGPRQDPSVINGLAGNPDNRTMEDIFAMLQNSAQVRSHVWVCSYQY